MKEILKYKKIKTLKQYNQYCDILEELIYKEDKSLKDEIELLEILIEVYDRSLQKETSKKLNPVELLKSILADADMNQKELAVQLGISKQLINDVLGYRRNISKSLVTKLSKFFKMSEEAFSRAYDLGSKPKKYKTQKSIASGSFAKETSIKYRVKNDLDAEIYIGKIKKDDLKIINGIGPKLEMIFHSNGIKTWKQLAETKSSKLELILAEVGARRYQMYNPKTWGRQAKLAHQGKWKELSKLKKVSR